MRENRRRIGKQIELEDVAGPKRDTERLDPPARRPRQSPVEMLDKDEPHHRMRKPADQHRAHRRTLEVTEILGDQAQHLGKNRAGAEYGRPAHAPWPKGAHQHNQEQKPGAAPEDVQHHADPGQRAARRVRACNPRQRPEKRTDDGDEQQTTGQTATPGKKDVKGEQEKAQRRETVSPECDVSHVRLPEPLPRLP